MVKELCDFLTAFKQYLYQAHLSAQGNAYSAHLLTEKIQNEVAEDIDRLKELYIAFTGDLSIADAQESLKQAELTLRTFLDAHAAQTYPQLIINCVELCKSCAIKAGQVSDGLAIEVDVPYHKALQNAVDDICEHLVRQQYLLQTEAQETWR
ncbi:MAG: hypothetical protein IKB61_02560 [Elusimicrobiaceae bacterium]|nr:hypothetical protein [Elusimicrobiaceae bacterium]MBR4355373.1 hypothetical protein [Elusimicrobiaceae bacterium]